MSASTELAAALSARPPAGTFFASHAYRLRLVQFDSPSLVVVLSGAKRLGQPPHTVRAGGFVMMHTAGARDVENLVLDGPYRSWGVAFPWRLVEVARQLLETSPVRARGSAESYGELAELEAPLLHLFALENREADPVQRSHRLLGVLLALAQAGHTRFLGASDPRFDAQIRALVVADPARSWSSTHVERLLGVSGATLRRRLASCRTTLREVVRDARLSHALSLLQTQRLSLKSVAWASGYRSVTSFHRNFTMRFGVEPRVVSGSRDRMSA